MDHVITGVAKFQKEVFPDKKATFQKLANGQNPEVLFITCADSRIDPNLLTQTDPGELFICRNAGNIVPPHSNVTGGITASIEFAVAALGVSHIIVCGHSDCGAMKGALNPEKLDGLPHVKEWLSHSRCASEVVKEKYGSLNMEHLEKLTEENVVQQLQHLRTHPSVAAKLATGQVKLHGWVYNIENGQVLNYDAEIAKFVPLGQEKAEKLSVA
ncbi:carbonic anhydrase [Aliiglaciecola sp. 3_MG-2023]|uniref:carbonic anhydrase n=1 Tax=Aliiglaciecola sp. 3_MG-2023 TaxID=3062644 RepID=UPI0026E33BA4|nr:carbonic anhydrase [Aliiglaciecola sp. 3_MG-2023]MDO6695406.1 carbonic anhydrase [Aliiglaciecola sp. 3_MG-2023]